MNKLNCFKTAWMFLCRYCLIFVDTEVVLLRAHDTAFLERRKLRLLVTNLLGFVCSVMFRGRNLQLRENISMSLRGRWASRTDTIGTISSVQKWALSCYRLWHLSELIKTETKLVSVVRLDYRDGKYCIMWVFTDSSQQKRVFEMAAFVCVSQW